MEYVGNGYYKIVAEHSGKSLDILNGSEKKNANLQQYAWNSSDAQLWKFVKADNGTYYIRSKLGTTIGLATSNVVSGTNVCMDQVNGNNIQKWVLKKAENAPVANGRYVISNAKFSENVISTKCYAWNICGCEKSDVRYKVYGSRILSNFIGSIRKIFGCGKCIE